MRVGILEHGYECTTYLEDPVGGADQSGGGGTRTSHSAEYELLWKRRCILLRAADNRRMSAFTREFRIEVSECITSEIDVSRRSRGRKGGFAGAIWVQLCRHAQSR